MLCPSLGIMTPVEFVDSLPARIMEGLEGTEISPGGRQAVLQEFSTALTWCLEKLGVTPEPGLKEREIKIKTRSQNKTWKRNP